MAYAVIRTDKMFGTDNRNGLRSVKYMGSGTTETAIDNGNVVVATELLSGTVGGTTVYEREIYKGVTPAATSNRDDVLLIATPELKYDEINYRTLDKFTNEAGAVLRGYRLHSGDIFSVTADALTGLNATPANNIGKIVELAASTKMKVVTSLTSGSTQIGTIVAVDVVGKYTYYVIQVI